jgi:hypothetical protein
MILIFITIIIIIIIGAREMGKCEKSLRPETLAADIVH